MKLRRRFGLSSILAVAFLLVAMALPAIAVDANISSEATFSNPTGPGAGAVAYCGPSPACPSGPASQIRWGTPLSGSRSGLGFAGVDQVISNSDPVAVGTMTHFNNPIAGGSGIDGVVMTVNVDVSAPGGSFGLSVPVALDIDETNNVAPCNYPSSTPCADAITIVSLGGDLASTHVLGDTSFTLTILGFLSGGEIVTQFISDEGGSNSVQLFATLEQNSRPVADAGADQVVEQTGALTNVILDGSGSTDPDGDALTYSWTTAALPGGASGSNPTVGLPAGTHTITLTVSDGELSDTDTVQVVVQDTTDPTIVGSRTPGPNAYGWNNTDVTVSFDCDDTGSGIASCSSPTTLTGEGAGQSVTGTAVDNAGNTAETTVGDINIDKTAPTIVFAGNAGTYTIDQTVDITCSASDSLSGLASSTCPEVHSSAVALGVGTHTLNATATDKAGNTANESTSFQVVVTYDALCELVRQYTDNQGIANSLCAKLQAAEAAEERGQTDTASNILEAFKNEVAAQSGKAFTADEAATLSALADLL